jgi:hypothetical protein
MEPTVEPYFAFAEDTQVSINIPDQIIFSAVPTGGAFAPDSRSGYLAIDPGTGELVIAHFLCATIEISSAPAATPVPSAPASPAESPGASPAESPEASPSETAAASPAESPAESPLESPAESPAASASASP